MSKSNIIPFDGSNQANSHRPASIDLSTAYLTISEACHIDQCWRSKGYSNPGDFIRDAILSFAGLQTNMRGANPPTTDQKFYRFGWKIWRGLNFSTAERRRIQAAAGLSTRKQPEVMEFVWGCLECFYEGRMFLKHPNWRQTVFSQGGLTIEQTREIVFLQIANLEQRKASV